METALRRPPSLRTITTADPGKSPWVSSRHLLLTLSASRTATEWLLIAGCLAAGGIMFREGLVAGLFGCIAGALLASEVVTRRASTPVGLVALVALALCQASSDNSLGLSIGLVGISATTLPLHRPIRTSLFLSQGFLLVHIEGVLTHGLVGDVPISWWQLALNIGIFNVISGVSSDLASRRRRAEASLVHQVLQSRSLAQALQREEVLRQAIMAIRDSAEGSAVIGRLLEECSDLMDADVVRVIVPSEGGPRDIPWPLYETSNEWLPFDVAHTATSGALRYVLDNRRPVWLVEPNHTDLRDLALPVQTGAIGLIPIGFPGGGCGILELVRSAPRPFADEERELVVALAEQATVAIEHASLRTELATRAHGAEALNDFSATIAGRRDLANIAEETVDAVRALYGADAAVFYLQDGDAAVPLASRGITASEFVGLHAECAGQRRMAQARAGKAQVVNLSTEDRRHRTQDLLTALRIATVVEVPLRGPDGIIGGLILYHRIPRVYHQHELDLLESFARQLGGGLELAQAYEVAKKLDRQREEFLALVSHDLRQPVAAIAAVAEALAESRQLTDAEKRAFEGLREQSRSLSRFAEDVLSISQVESGGFQLNPVVFDLCSLVKGLARQSLGAERIEVETPEGPLPVLADPQRIGQVVDNLVRNALDFSSPMLPVTVTVTLKSTRVAIEVRDRGVGFLPEEIPQLFKKYGSVSSLRVDGSTGFGLGLYLCQRLMEAHGGMICAHSDGRGLGATFRIELSLTGQK